MKIYSETRDGWKTVERRNYELLDLAWMYGFCATYGIIVPKVVKWDVRESHFSMDEVTEHTIQDAPILSSIDMM